MMKTVMPAELASMLRNGSGVQVFDVRLDEDREPVPYEVPVIKQILDHLDRRAVQKPPAFRPLARAPPQGELPGFKDQDRRYPPT